MRCAREHAYTRSETKQELAAICNEAAIAAARAGRQEVCARALSLSPAAAGGLCCPPARQGLPFGLMCLRVVHPLDQVKAADFFGGLNQYLTSRTTGGGVGATGLSRARRAPV
jgi:hypothetical protein